MVYFYFEFHYSEKIPAGQPFSNFSSIKCSFTCSRYNQGEFKKKGNSNRVKKWSKQGNQEDRKNAKIVHNKRCKEVYTQDLQAQEYIKKFCKIAADIDEQQKKTRIQALADHNLENRENRFKAQVNNFFYNFLIFSNYKDI